MARYTFLILFWSFIITPMQAQIVRCEIIRLKDAIVISEYPPCPRLDSTYIDGDHYIYFNAKKVNFKMYSNYNKYLIGII